MQIETQRKAPHMYICIYICMRIKFVYKDIYVYIYISANQQQRVCNRLGRPFLRHRVVTPGGVLRQTPPRQTPPNKALP